MILTSEVKRICIYLWNVWKHNYEHENMSDINVTFWHVRNWKQPINSLQTWWWCVPNSGIMSDHDLWLRKYTWRGGWMFLTSAWESFKYVFQILSFSLFFVWCSDDIRNQNFRGSNSVELQRVFFCFCFCFCLFFFGVQVFFFIIQNNQKLHVSLHFQSGGAGNDCLNLNFR